jgi:chorismate mutase
MDFNNISTLHYDNSPILIAGPCSAETLEQTLDTAKRLKSIGVKIFRAGLWKPRTLPETFHGVGEEGLTWLRQVKEETGMLLATEVATREHVELCLDNGIDVLWIGARTTTNPFAVQEIADALQGHDNIIVLVKNPVNPDIDLWVGALQRIYNAGITRIGAIHRGFGTGGNHIYRNVPEWHIAIELHRRIPELPILCDPSHMGGSRDLIPTLSQQALDMGFDGLFVESHCNPDKALSDSKQQITPEELCEVLNSLVVRRMNQPNEVLNMLRQQIDDCDNNLVELLNKRMSISREIGCYKKEHDMQVVQTSRFDEILTLRVKQAQEMGMSSDFMKRVMTAIHQESVRQQIDIMNNKDKK